ncbi:MAG: phospholipase [Terrimonas sp.]|nr:phospholipase [Terrimonas sp.]
MSSGNFSNASSAYSSGNKVKLVRGGKAYFETLLAMIGQARYSLHLQTYIYDEDRTGLAVADALVQAAARGVKVFMLLDGYASQKLSKNFIQRLKTAGIHFRWFSPLFRTRYFYFGRRMHHKVIVVDENLGLVGGVNISNRYNDLPGQPAWLDWAVFAEGEVSRELYNLCSDLWNKSSWGKTLRDVLDGDANFRFRPGSCFVRVRRNDWVRGKSQISRSYIEMFKKAKSHILIMSSYFLPGNVFRKNMMKAARRGVVMKVVVAGKSDVWLAKEAERYIYSWLLRNGVLLYEYQPNVLHGKLSTYDNRWVTVGSYNVNNISAYAAIELNLDILDGNFAGIVTEEMNRIILQDCIQVDKDSYNLSNTFLKRIWQKACYEFIRLVFTLFTFYFKKHL